MSTEVISKEFAEISNIDYRLLTEKAQELICEQALMDKEIKDLTIKDLETSRAKTNNFLEALSGLVEISHRIELLSAEKDKFKRKDELDLLHALRETTTKQAKLLSETTDIAAQHLKNLEEKLANEENPEEITKICDSIELMQTNLERGVDTNQKLAATANRIIQTERFSGGRGWGFQQRAMTTNIKLVEMLDGQEGAGKKKIREMSAEDIAKMSSEEPDYEEDF